MKTTSAWEIVKLVVQGFTETYGVDYDQTFSPVVKFESIWTVLSLCAQQDMHIVQFDICTTFLHGDRDEEIYMLQPEGFTSSGQELKDCWLQKSLYGLKQSSRVLNRKFNDFLTKLNLHPHRSQSLCVFNKGKATTDYDDFCGWWAWMLCPKFKIGRDDRPSGTGFWRFQILCRCLCQVYTSYVIGQTSFFMWVNNYTYGAFFVDLVMRINKS